MSDEKRLTVRINKNLYDKLQEYADYNNQSLNAAITTAIENIVHTEKINKQIISSPVNFEQRHLIGQEIFSKNIDTNMGIVMVKGLVYRYLTEDNEPIQENKNYIITNINGNVVIIKESE